MTDFTLSEIVRTGDQEVCITEIRDDGTCRVESTRDGHSWTTQLNYLKKIQWPMWVNVYELHRCYGGPEEGGWYYDAGTLVCSVPVFHWGEEVMEVARLEHHYPETGHRGQRQGGKDMFDSTFSLAAERPSWDRSSHLRRIAEMGEAGVAEMAEAFRRIGRVDVAEMAEADLAEVAGMNTPTTAAIAAWPWLAP